MKVLITGANGMVAKAAIKHCSEIGDAVTGYTRQKLDISNKEQVFDTVEREKPDAIFNCAAYTDVDGAEIHHEKALSVNVVGVENLAIASRKINCKFVTISTDYVFDGMTKGFYSQRDTPNPLAVYAKTKLEGEIVARNTYARSIIVRTGWIFGHGGTNFLSVMHKLLADGKRIKTIKDSYGTPTFASDLAMRLRELAVLDMPAVFHVTNAGGGISYKDFASKVCELGGFDSRLIDAISSDELKRPAPRPKNSSLECLFSEHFGLSLMSNWEMALEKFLQ